MKVTKFLCFISIPAILLQWYGASNDILIRISW